jgi:hypothetical protein
MYDFSELLKLDEKSFRNKLSKIDSADIINYLKNCDDKRIKIKYYKRIKKILGGNYLKLIKTAITDKGNISCKNMIIKYSLYLLNIILSSILCIIIFTILNKMPLDYYIYGFDEIIILSIIAFIFSTFPQIIFTILICFLTKIIKMKKVVEILMTIVLGIIMSIVFTMSWGRGRTISIKEFMLNGYTVYLSIIISGVIFRIILYKINKKCPNVA